MNGERWSSREWLALAAVTLVAGALRIGGLGEPTRLVFDEIFYVRNACFYAAGPLVCGIDAPVSRAHPPLGEWLIGAGIRLFGDEPFGWRVAAAIAGVVTVALLFALARRLLGRAISPRAATGAALAAAGLLAVDFLHVVMSRVAMLDVFVTLFVVLAIFFAVLDGESLGDRHAGLIGRVSLGRPWRLATGIAVGAAIATKWNGAYVWLAVIGLLLAWGVAARLRQGLPSWRSALAGTIRQEAASMAVLLVIVPVVVYVATYVGRAPGSLVGLPWAEGTAWRSILDHQVAMLAFHVRLAGDHPYESPPWAWLLLKRPVALYFAQEGGSYREMLALGNPLVWWPGLAIMAALAARWARARWDAHRPEAVIVGAALALYLPWLVFGAARSQVFIWYLLPAIPFLCLGMGLAATLVWRSLAGRAVAAVFAISVIATFVFYLPLLTASPTSPAEWRARILFDDCARPGAPTLLLPDDQIDSGPPPTGWCWI